MAATLVINDLITDVKLFGGVTDAERISNTIDLTTLVVAAVRKHNETYVVCDSNGVDSIAVPLREREPAKLICLVDLCNVRAAIFSVEASVSGSPSGFETNRDTPFFKTLKLAGHFAALYSDACAQLGLTNYAGVAVSSDTVIESHDSGNLNDPDLAPTPPTPVLTANNLTVAGDGTLVLSWAVNKVRGFSSFSVFHIEGADPLFQDWNTTNPAIGSRINDNGQGITTIPKETIRSVKLSGLTFATATVNRFIVTVQNTAGKISYSNELIVTQP